MPLAFTRWGRKKAIISAAVVFTVGAIVMGAAPNKEETKMEMESK